MNLSAETSRQANELIGAVRRAQRDSGKMVGGMTFLDDAVHESIRAVVARSSIIQTLKDDYGLPEAALTNLMERFEEVARRREQVVSEELRPAIYKKLTIELLTNIEFFNVPPEKALDLVPATLFQGEVTGLPNKHINNDTAQSTYGEYFSNDPGMFKRAATGNPGAPETFLDGVVKKIDELPAKHINDDPKAPTYGQYFGISSHIFRYAAINYPGEKGAARFLDDVVKQVQTLPEKHINNDSMQPTYGEYFGNASPIFIQAATRAPKSARQFLNNVVEQIEELPHQHINGDPAQPTYGEYFGHESGIYRHAAVHHPGKENSNDSPAKFLDDCVARVKRLEQVFDTSEDSKLKRSDLIRASYSASGDPDKYLNDLIAERRGAKRKSSGKGVGAAA